MNLNFNRDSRLKRSSDFKHVFDEKDIKLSSRYVLILAKNNNLGYARLGLVVGKKNVRDSVARNWVKRHIRETFRLQKDEFGSLDIVVLVRKGLSSLRAQDLNNLLNNQWKKLKHMR